MQIVVQKLPLNENKSFVARTYTTPYFETPWHQHKEIELLLITKGQGTALIGDYIGAYGEGDVFLLGENLPHWFKKETDYSIGSAIVVHFSFTSWGERFFELPETKKMKQLLLKSKCGIKARSPLKEDVASYIRMLERTDGLKLMRFFLHCFELLTESSHVDILSSKSSIHLNEDESRSIDIIFQYCFNNFSNQIKLEDVASAVHLSVPTFIRFFKRSTKKNFSYFLKEIRINQACRLLRDTNKPVNFILTECGYNNHTNFVKQFYELKKVSPLQYRNLLKQY